jgi:hypothetical protein
VSGLVLRISQVTPLPAARIVAGCRDAEVVLRDQVRAPERVRAVVPVDDVPEALAWLETSGRRHARRGLRCALVRAGAVAL